MSDKELWPRPKFSRDVKALTAKLILILLSVIALVATLYPLVDQNNITPSTASIISIVGLIIFLLYAFLVFYEISTLDGKRIFKQSDSTSIKKYMLNWIAYGGRVAIWTRDMSWANDDSSKDLLLKKAQSGELIICLPTHTSFSKELEEKGGEIYVYGMELLSNPSARFTIAFYGRDGSKVAIGRARADKHIIEEFDTGSHPAFNLANELVQIAKNASQKKNGNQI
ncbi:hypothetical protein [Erwinia rhapontici]|uniref:hypothetical protein n=1 Tax=Erwinia rhapontici TaxID=55212 RepID=UPI003BA2ACB1